MCKNGQSEPCKYEKERDIITFKRYNNKLWSEMRLKTLLQISHLRKQLNEGETITIF